MLLHRGSFRRSAALFVSFLFATVLQATPVAASAPTDGPTDAPGSRAELEGAAADLLSRRTSGHNGDATPSSSASSETWVDAGLIAYIFENGVWTVDPDGSGATRITPTTFSAREPAWSPDGTKIVFAYVATSISDPGYGI